MADKRKVPEMLNIIAVGVFSRLSVGIKKFTNLILRRGRGEFNS